ncbi:hypothetical protein F2Q70_00003992 [Brassica cretica]|uniref:Uncharacterized protein n=1 Tax=Brassica cretica TaxID=69181 RepID=A0A8S9IR72_BRACR|nr:hypothetical protein F2Q70_00003992 [Brassica cretica]
MPLGSRPLSKSYYAALCFVQKATVRLLSRAGVTLTLKRVRQLPGLSTSAGVNLPGVVMQAPVLLLPMSGVLFNLYSVLPAFLFRTWHFSERICTFRSEVIWVKLEALNLASQRRCPKRAALSRERGGGDRHRKGGCGWRKTEI